MSSGKAIDDSLVIKWLYRARLMTALSSNDFAGIVWWQKRINGKRQRHWQSHQLTGPDGFWWQIKWILHKYRILGVIKCPPEERLMIVLSSNTFQQDDWWQSCHQMPFRKTIDDNSVISQPGKGELMPWPWPNPGNIIIMLLDRSRDLSHLCPTWQTK